MQGGKGPLRISGIEECIENVHVRENVGVRRFEEFAKFCDLNNSEVE